MRAPAERLALRSDARPRSWYHAPRGSEFVYQLRASMRTHWEVEGAGRRPETAIGLRARLSLLVVDRRGDELVVRWQLREPVLSVSAAQAPEQQRAREDLEADLGRSFLVRMKDHGATLGYRFSGESLRGNREWYRCVASAMRCVFASPEDKAWEVAESDPAGKAVYSYRMRGEEDLRIRRERERFDYDAELLPSGAARADVRFSRELGFPRQLRWRDRQSLAMDAVRSTFTCDFGLDAELVQALEGRSVPVIDWEEPWEGASSSASGDGDGSSDPESEERERRYWSKLLANASLAQLLDELERIVREDTIGSKAVTELRERLVWLFRLRPEAMRGLRALLQSRYGNEPFVSVVLGALGQAGTAPAQALLVEHAQDLALGESTRLSALWAMSQLESPTLATRQFAAQLANMGGWQTPLGNSALLLSGVLAGLPGEGRAAALETLRSLEQSATQEQSLQAWLSSVANAASPELRDVLDRYAGHENNALRLRAVRGLAQIEGSAVVPALERHVTTDPDARVRLAALVGLEGRPVGAELFAPALRDPSPQVRSRALEAIGDRLSRSSTRAKAQQLLEETARTSPDKDLRARARELLGQR